MASSRRRFLLMGVLGGTALGLGGLALLPGAPVAAPAGLRFLDARSWAVLAAIARSMCPGGGDLPSADALDIATLLDGTLASMHPADAGDLRTLLRLLDNALVGLAFGGMPLPLTRASPERQATVLRDWRDSHLAERRKAFLALRGLVMAAYWGHRGTWAGSGYPGPPDYGQARAPADDHAALVAEGLLRLQGQDLAEGTPPVEARP